MGRWLSRAERAARDKKIVELYQQGVSAVNLRLRFGGVDVFRILRREGIEAQSTGANDLQQGEALQRIDEGV